MFGWLIDALIGLAVLAGGGFVLWWQGRQAGKKAAAEQAARQNQQDQERIRDAVDSSRAGGAHWTERLRKTRK